MKEKLLIGIWPLVRYVRQVQARFKPAWYERQLLKQYKSNSVDFQLTGIVSMQDGFFTSGGLVDRIKGIVTGYYLSQTLGLDFHIFFSDDKDPLVSIVQKENIHLVFERNKLNFSKKVSAPIVLYNNRSIDVDSVKKKINSRRQLHLYSNMDLLFLFHSGQRERYKIWADMFHRIFDPTRYGCMTANSESNSESIGIHLRFIGLLGDFKDLRQYVLPEEQKIRMLEWCREKIYKIANEHDAPIIVVSDSAVFLKTLLAESMINGLFAKLVVDSSSIGHTALENTASIFEKAVIDFNSLSSCSKVYQLRYGKMHNSDFSRYAAMVNLAPYEIIEPDVEN